MVNKSILDGIGNPKKHTAFAYFNVETVTKEVN